MAGSDKRLESWDDVRHAFDDLLKSPVDRFAWHRRILKRYKDGCLTLHLHVGGRLFGTPWLGCVECHASAGHAISLPLSDHGASDTEDWRPFVILEPKASDAGFGQGQQRQAM